MAEAGLGRVTLFSAFAFPQFRIFWLATLTSHLGTLVQAVGAGWLMTGLTDSREMIALVQTSTTLPMLVFSLPAGALADLGDRRQIMLWAQIFMLAVGVVLVAVTALGAATPWLLIATTFCLGAGQAVHIAAWQASVGDLVPRTALPAAILLNSVGFNSMRSVGPAVGGVIVAAAGAVAAFALNAASYVVMFVVLLRWKGTPRPTGLPREAVGHAIEAGLRYSAMSPHIWTVLLRAVVFGTPAIAILALLPSTTREGLDGSAVLYGLLLGAFGVGAIGAAFARPRLGTLFENEGIARLAFAFSAAGTAIVGLSPSPGLSGLGCILGGAGWVMALSMFNTSIQLGAPRWVVGRTLSIYQAGTFGGMALGAWLWGRLAEAQGLDTAHLAAAGVLAFGGIVGLRFPLPAFSTADLQPLDRFRAPAPRLDLRERSGPIMVMVDYEIAEADVPEFLALMRQRRRVRIRDGARRWALLRDLESPDHWTESYHVPTWDEYIRHHARRTVADAETWDKLAALHRGAKPPVVHRMIERHTVPPVDDAPLKPFSDPH